MKIFFVGMHNKPGKHALDDTTRTGKIVNEIIHRSLMDPAIFEKTNFSDTDKLPREDEMDWHMQNYLERTKPQAGDLFILLGSWVRFYFKKPTGTRIIPVRHPSSFIGRTDKEKYITEVLERLLLEVWKKEEA
jgi:hypothetical protein